MGDRARPRHRRPPARRRPVRPERLPELVAPLERDECDGRPRFADYGPGRARRGGMPLYKYVGNRILTAWENAMAGTSLTEWHSGYRAYAVGALRDIDFDANSDGFDFDTQILLRSTRREAHPSSSRSDLLRGRSATSTASPMRATWRCHTLRYRMQRVGFAPAKATHGNRRADDYELKSSRGRRTAGCSTGSVGGADARPRSRVRRRMAGRARAEAGPRSRRGRRRPRPGVIDRVDRFVQADLDRGIPPRSATGSASCSPPTSSSTSGNRASCCGRSCRSWLRAGSSSRASRTSRTGTRCLRVLGGPLRLRPAGHPRPGHVLFFTRDSSSGWRRRHLRHRPTRSRGPRRSKLWSGDVGWAERDDPRRRGRRPPRRRAAADGVRLSFLYELRPVSA